ncbi:MAG: TadE family protein [Bryobacteraceae bacterium]
MNQQRRRRQRGTELIEFALVATFLLPLLFGTVVMGLNLHRSIQVTQLSRDSGHMYSRSVDFSDPANQAILVRLAQGLGIQSAGGSGVVILSTVTYIGTAQCAAAGLSSGACTNLNYPVITNRIVIGNASARSSAFGTPNPELIGSKGDVSNYLTNTSARADGFSSVLAMQPGDLAYVSEVYVPSSDYGMPGFEMTGVYCRTVF